jgi:hypothetical protein
LVCREAGRESKMRIRDRAEPIALAKNAGDVPRAFDEIVGVAQGECCSIVARFSNDPSEVAALRVETELADLMAAVATHLTAMAFVLAHQDAEFVATTKRQAREGPDAEGALVTRREKSKARVQITFLSGVALYLCTAYFAPVRARKRKKRGATGSGSYPILEGLGIWNRCTAGLASSVARLTATCSSVAEASAVLALHGCLLRPDRVHRVTSWFAAAAVQERIIRTAAAIDGFVFSMELAGKRIMIGVDGTMLQVREGQKRGRRRKKTRRRATKPTWREAKMFVIYVLDDNGDIERKDIAPVYDGTLGDCAAIMRLLTAELLARGARLAKEIILVADGAFWIWERADQLTRDVGIDSAKVTKVADFYHAAEHLTEIADLVSSLKRRGSSERERWLKEMRRLLLKGNIERLIEVAEALCVGRKAKAIDKKINYFRVRVERMRYAQFKALGIPRGSGAMESAIRRVVCLRLKGASISWTARGAEGVLLLRSYAKAGRWEELVHRVIKRPDKKPVDTWELVSAA